MITISLCMIVRNEEQVLGRCLSSVAGLVDEIIIVDTGSDDRTKEIAAQFTDKIYDFPWINDFSAARNFAYSHAVMDYQMWMDADDILPDIEKGHFLALKEILDPDVDMVTMKYHTSFDEDGNPVLTSTRERLTKRSRHFMWQGPVHECIALQGNLYHSNIAFHHRKPYKTEDSMRNIKIYEQSEQKGQAFSPRELYYFARELKDHEQYAKAVYYFERFLSGGEGWVEDNIAACFNLAICYKILGDTDKILPILFKSFSFDSPRAEICCKIGYRYMDLNQYAIALNWFQIAFRMEPPASLGFVLPDYKDYIPLIESCVCCCALKQYEQAVVYNEKAALIKPDNSAVLHNRDFLRGLV